MSSGHSKGEVATIEVVFVAHVVHFVYLLDAVEVEVVYGVAIA